jgi:hypothetical protein
MSTQASRLLAENNARKVFVPATTRNTKSLSHQSIVFVPYFLRGISSRCGFLQTTFHTKGFDQKPFVASLNNQKRH